MQINVLNDLPCAMQGKLLAGRNLKRESLWFKLTKLDINYYSELNYGLIIIYGLNCLQWALLAGSHLQRESAGI